MPGGFPTWSKENQEAFKRRLSEKTTKRNLERWQEPAYREKMLAVVTNNGFITQELHGKERIADLTAAARRIAVDPVIRKLRSDNQKNRLATDPAYKEFCAEQCRAIGKMPEVRKSRSDTLKRLHKSSKVFQDAYEDGWKKSAKKSKPEKELFDRLVALGITNLEHQLAFWPYFLDIAHLPSKTDIEVDSPYWHSLNPKRDRKRDRFMRKNGWRVFRIKLVKNKVTERDFVRICKHLQSQERKP